MKTILTFLAMWLCAVALAGSVDSSPSDVRTTSSAITSTIDATTFTLARDADAVVLLVDSIDLGDNAYFTLFPGHFDSVTSEVLTAVDDPITTIAATTSCALRVEAERFCSPRTTGAAAVCTLGDANAGTARIRVAQER